MLVHYVLAFALCSILAWGSVARAANFVVNTTLDSTDSNLGNGLCGNSEGFCSLRAAVQQANALGGGPHTIALGAHSYEVTTVQTDPLGLDEEDAAASGDLDVTSEITITGVSATGTTVEGGGDGTPADRVFHVLLGGDLTLRQLTVRDGQATTSVQTSSGGGIYNAGILDLADCVVSDNEAISGGGVLNAGVLTIDSCTFSGNDAQGVLINPQGGALATFGVFADVEITASTLSGNSAGLSGHAIYANGGGTLAIENSTLSGNLGSSAPALLAENVDVTLTNTTIVGNAGVGLRSFSFDETNTLDVANTIVANNGGDECSISPTSSPILTITNSLSSDSSCGFDLEDTDPLLNPLAYNGGSTFTHLPLPGSPAIDAGAESPVCPDVDQRGVARPVDGDGDTNVDCDIGAVEVPEPGALAGGVLALALVAWLARRRA